MEQTTKNTHQKIADVLDFTEFRDESEDYGNRFGWKQGYEKPLFALVEYLDGRVDDIFLEGMFMQILEHTRATNQTLN